MSADKHRAVVVDPTSEALFESRPAAVTNVSLSDGFWSSRIGRIASHTIPKMDRMNETTGRYDNFRKASGEIDGTFEGIYYNDSDVYKWLECAAWSLAHYPDSKLEARMDQIVEWLEAAQDDDGYLDTFYQAQDMGERWTQFRFHEMYCAGHLIQAAVAYHRTRGKRRLLDVAIRFADHICDVFGADRNTGVDTHPEVEMALVELYRETGNRRYLDQAAYFVDARGRHEIDVIPGTQFDQEYHQNRAPFRELARMEGHSVRMLYLTCGAADVHAETGDKELRDVLDRLWLNMTACHLYVTGGLGARYATEGFARDYWLPNRDAYAETCAAVASIMWNWRMLLLDTDRRYADLIELTLYNGLLSGVSLDGERFFYVNPLADDGEHRRQDWFDCACCPSNVSRTLASLPGYFYTTTDDACYLHLYDSNRASLTLGNGRQVELAVTTNYPWDGRIDIELMSDVEFDLCLRIPAWAGDGWQASINGETIEDPGLDKGYLRLRRDWSDGDRVALDIDMPVRVLRAHPLVQENAGRAAVQCGPVVYCFEAVDNDGTDTDRLLLDTTDAGLERVATDVDGAIAIRASGRVVSFDDWGDAIYRNVADAENGVDSPTRTLVATPYYTWANREPGSMNVWVRASGSDGNDSDVRQG